MTVSAIARKSYGIGVAFFGADLIRTGQGAVWQEGSGILPAAKMHRVKALMPLASGGMLKKETGHDGLKKVYCKGGLLFSTNLVGTEQAFF